VADAADLLDEQVHGLGRSVRRATGLVVGEHLAVPAVDGAGEAGELGHVGVGGVLEEHVLAGLYALDEANLDGLMANKVSYTEGEPVNPGWPCVFPRVYKDGAPVPNDLSEVVCLFWRTVRINSPRDRHGLLRLRTPRPRRATSRVVPGAP